MFTVPSPATAAITYTIQKYTLDYFGANQGPRIELNRVNPSDHSDIISPILNKTVSVIPNGQKSYTKTIFLKLGPGTYKIEAKAYWKGTDETGQASQDKASILVDYEYVDPNKLIKTKKGAGVRIAKITEFAHQGDPNPKIMKFKYELDGDYSSGVTGKEPKYSYDAEFVFHDAQTASDVLTKDRIFTSGNLLVLGNSEGNSVGYQKVQVLHGENGEFGMDEYHYSTSINAATSYYTSPPFQSPTSFAYKTGLLLAKKTYKNIGDNQFQIVKEQRTLFSNWTHFNKEIDAVKVGYLGGLFSGQNYLWKYKIGEYKHIMGYTQPIENRIITYDEAGDDSLSVTTLYEYDSEEKYLKKQSSIPVEINHAKRTEYYYPEDFTSPPASIQKMIDNNILSSPIEVVQSKRDLNNNWAVIGAQYDLKKIDNNHVVPSHLNSLAVDAPINNFSPIVANNNTPDSRYYETISYDKYDGGYPIQTKSIDGVITSYLRDSNGALVAKCENGIHDNLAYVSLENGMTEVSGSNVSLNNSLTTTTSEVFSGKVAASGGSLSGSFSPFIPGKYVISFVAKAVWNQQGYVQMMNGSLPNVNLTNYWKKYEVVFDQASFSLQLFNSFIDEIRVYPVGAKMITYNFENLVGYTSINDHDGKPNHYEYDELGRLRLTRDHNKNITQRISYDYDIVETIDPTDIHLTAEMVSDYRYKFQVENVTNINLRYEWNFGNAKTEVVEGDDFVVHAFPPVTTEYLVTVKIFDENNNPVGGDNLHLVVLVTYDGGEKEDECSEVGKVLKQQQCFSPNPNTMDFTINHISGVSYEWYLDGKIDPGSSTRLYSKSFGCGIGDFEREVRVEVLLGGEKFCSSSIVTVKEDFCDPTCQ